MEDGTAALVDPDAVFHRHLQIILLCELHQLFVSRVTAVHCSSVLILEKWKIKKQSLSQP